MIELSLARTTAFSLWCRLLLLILLPPACFLVIRKAQRGVGASTSWQW